jgi:hypothetical protein
MDRNNLVLMTDINNGLATSYPLTGLTSGTHYFSLTTYDYSDNESTYSDIVSRTVVNIPGADHADGDGDGVGDAYDNCTLAANTGQRDTDGDNIGNQCDCDFNQDNFCGGPDFTLFLGCFNAATNGDPTCEAADMNGDGFVGGPDLTLFIGGFNVAPGPSGL